MDWYKTNTKKYKNDYQYMHSSHGIQYTQNIHIQGVLQLESWVH